MSKGRNQLGLSWAKLRHVAHLSSNYRDKNHKQAEAEGVPSSSLVEVKVKVEAEVKVGVEVEVGVGVEVGVEVGVIC